MTSDPHAWADQIRVKPRLLRRLNVLSSSTSPDGHGTRVAPAFEMQPGANSDRRPPDETVRTRIVPRLPAIRAWEQICIEVKRSQRHIECLRSQALRALEQGDMGKALQRQDLILKSRGGMLWAAFRADRKLREKDRRRPRDAALIRSVAERMSPFEPCTEKVRISFKRKRSGRCRPLCSYELENRARQYLAKFAFEPFSAQGDNQFGSVDRAIEHVSSALSSGYKWAVQVDLKDCFASLDVERLAELIPMPRRVISHVFAEPPRGARVLGRTPGNSITFLGQMWTRLGLPQGSAAASLVANHLIALALKEMPALGVSVFYMDDGLFLTKTKKEAEQIKDALYRVFSVDGPVGHIAFKHCMIRRASDGFDFLGYYIKRVKGEAVCIPSEGKTANVRAVVSHFLSLNRRHERLRAHVRSWCAAHRHWLHVDGFRDHLLQRIDAAERLGYDPSPPYGTETMGSALWRMLSRFPVEKRMQIRDTLAEGMAIAHRTYGNRQAR